MKELYKAEDVQKKTDQILLFLESEGIKLTQNELFYIALEYFEPFIINEYKKRDVYLSFLNKIKR